MQQSVFSVFDNKARVYLQPFHAVNTAVAIRMIKDALSQTTHMFSQHSDDFNLFQLATFDDENGEFTVIPPANLGFLTSFKEPV